EKPYLLPAKATSWLYEAGNAKFDPFRRWPRRGLVLREKFRKRLAKIVARNKAVRLSNCAGPALGRMRCGHDMEPRWKPLVRCAGAFGGLPLRIFSVRVSIQHPRLAATTRCLRYFFRHFLTVVDLPFATP